MLIIIAITASAIAAVALISSFLLRKELIRIAAHLRDIREADTNAVIFSEYHNKGINELVVEINKHIEHSKQDKLMHTRSQAGFRATITNISHDLRTPLTAARGYLQMLQAGGVSPDKQTEFLQVVERRLIFLQKLLDELFVYARIESGDYIIELSTVNLIEMIEDALALHYENHNGLTCAPIVSLPDYPVYVTGDPKAFARVFQNLFQNAQLHGDGVMSIKLTQDNNSISITVSNSCSLEDDAVSKLFDRFFTADRSRTSGTTGLGLAITKELVEKMNGRIRADYADGELHITMTYSPAATLALSTSL